MSLPCFSSVRRRRVVGTIALLAGAVLGIVIAWRFACPAEQLAAAEEALLQHGFQDARSRLDNYLLHWPGDQKAHLLAARAADFFHEDPSYRFDYPPLDAMVRYYKNHAPVPLLPLSTAPTAAGRIHSADNVPSLPRRAAGLCDIPL